ncbi:MAG: amidohydrolase [Deltaproteobacteria bacterium]|jgi:predicted amidohydrolase YtcJ|nr:amidohydrolase [Deltaproteobacteria bacterium]
MAGFFPEKGESGEEYPPPLIFRNARVSTLDPARPAASVLGTLAGRLLYVGDDPLEAERETRARLKAGRFPSLKEIESVDLKGLSVLPGLIDSHAHVLHEGARLSQLDLGGLSYGDALAAIAAKARDLEPSAWLRGRGWDQNLYPGRRFPGKSDLDRVAPSNPALLDRIDKHSLWVNSAALKRCGVDRGAVAPPGGEIVREPSGEPSGILVGRAMFLVLDKAPPLDGLDPARTFLSAQREALGLGLTAVADCGSRSADYFLFRELYGAGKGKIRFRTFVVADPWDEELLKDGPIPARFQGKLSLDGVKIFSDGSLGSWSAWLSEDYRDRKGRRGDHNYETAELQEMLRKAKERNLQVAIHVIGDAAASQAVAAMGAVLGKRAPERRWRLEHFQVASPAIWGAALELGLIPSIQSVGLMTDLRMAPERLGPEKLRDSYAWGRLRRAGFILVNGSDAPIESPNPFHGIYAAVTRQDLTGYPPQGFQKEDALTREEALWSYTSWPAWAMGEEANLGRLAVGKYADFIAIDRDFWDAPDADLWKIKTLLTVVGGERVSGQGF